MICTPKVSNFECAYHISGRFLICVNFHSLKIAVGNFAVFKVVAQNFGQNIVYIVGVIKAVAVIPTSGGNCQTRKSLGFYGEYSFFVQVI